ncbi:hypothetical protein ACTFTM_20675 [Micromonospora sp. RB23]
MTVNAVWSSNDWDPLEEVVLGTAVGFTPPPVDPSLRHFFERPVEAEREKIPSAMLDRVIEEAEEDFRDLTAVLESHGVAVRRPEPLAPGQHYASPDWASVAMHALMPRDCLSVIGDMLIEVPMPMRSRYFEVFPYRDLLREYFDSGARWLSAPKPRLPDSTYIYESNASVVADDEPLFDAANLLRCGYDIFFNVSSTGNRRGARWLQRVLGPDFTVHEMSICADHVDTTLHILRPGLLLANAAKMTPEMIPSPLRSWKTLWVTDIENDGFAFDWPRASRWVGMNLLALGPDRVLVPSNQVSLMRQLEQAGVEPVPVRFRHGRSLGGGLHCCSLDIRRRGELTRHF